MSLKAGEGKDLIMVFPSEVSEVQLKELGIIISLVGKRG
jgi:hypothetical protein